jgi:hypothetical protein
MFRIEDELHDESFGQDFATMDAAVAELRRLATAPRRRAGRRAPASRYLLQPHSVNPL